MTCHWKCWPVFRGSFPSAPGELSVDIEVSPKEDPDLQGLTSLADDRVGPPAAPVARVWRLKGWQGPFLGGRIRRRRTAVCPGGDVSRWSPADLRRRGSVGKRTFRVHLRSDRDSVRTLGLVTLSWLLCLTVFRIGLCARSSAVVRVGGASARAAADPWPLPPTRLLLEGSGAPSCAVGLVRGRP